MFFILLNLHSYVDIILWRLPEMTGMQKREVLAWISAGYIGST